MKRGLYFPIVSLLLCLLFASNIFAKQINALSPLWSIIFFLILGAVLIGCLLLAMWDTSAFDNKNDKPPKGG
jgi:hypothetical protein